MFQLDADYVVAGFNRLVITSVIIDEHADYAENHAMVNASDDRAPASGDHSVETAALAVSL